MVNIWLNLLLFFSSNCLLNFIIKHFFFFIFFSDFFFVFIDKVSILILLSVVLMWLYGLTKRNELTLGICLTNVALMGHEFDVSIILLNYLGIDPCLWLLWSIWYLGAFFLIKNVTMKGRVSKFTIMLH